MTSKNRLQQEALLMPPLPHDADWIAYNDDQLHCIRCNSTIHLLDTSSPTMCRPCVEEQLTSTQPSSTVHVLCFLLLWALGVGLVLMDLITHGHLL